MNLLATAAATVAVKAMNTSMSGGNDVSSDISYIEPKKLFIADIGKFGVPTGSCWLLSFHS